MAKFRKGGGASPALSRLAKEWYQLQVEYEFVSTFQWWGTKENVTADGLTREDLEADARLHPRVVDTLHQWMDASSFGELVSDLMASPVSAIMDPRGLALPFVSRYHTGSEVAVDILSQDLTRLLDALPRRAASGPAVGYCFPPATMRSAVVAYARTSGRRWLFVLPREYGPWYPTVRLAQVGVLPLVAPDGQSLFSAAGPGGVYGPVPALAGTAWDALLCQF